MDDIDIICKSDFGIAFCWKRSSLEDHKKINFVFDKSALHLSRPEVLLFSDLINDAIHRLVDTTRIQDIEELTFIETPMPQLSLILSYEDLICLQNLVEGALIELGIADVLYRSKKIGI